MGAGVCHEVCRGVSHVVVWSGVCHEMACGVMRWCVELGESCGVSRDYAVIGLEVVGAEHRV